MVCGVIIMSPLTLLCYIFADKIKKSNEEDESSHTTTENRTLNSADISDYLQEEVSKERIELLSNKNMAEAIHEFVDKMEGDSVSM